MLTILERADLGKHLHVCACKCYPNVRLFVHASTTIWLREEAGRDGFIIKPCETPCGCPFTQQTRSSLVERESREGSPVIKPCGFSFASLIITLMKPGALSLVAFGSSLSLACHGNAERISLPLKRDLHASTATELNIVRLHGSNHPANFVFLRFP
jgi:hypothetical protein